MRHRLVGHLARLVTTYPWWVLAVGLVLLVGSSYLSAHLQLRPSRLDMVPPNDPDVLSWQRFNEDFGGVNTVLLVVEGPPREIRSFADEAAATLRPLKEWIRSVTYRVDIERFEAQGLFLLTEQKLADIEEGLINLKPFVRDVCAEPTIARVLSYLAEEIGDEEAPPMEVPKTVKSMEFVLRAVEALNAQLARVMAPSGSRARVPPKVFPSLEIKAQGSKRLEHDPDGYLLSKSQDRLLIVLSPAVDLRQSSITRQFKEAVDRKLEPLLKRHGKVQVATTGGPIRSLEEEATVRKDMRVTAIVAGVGVVVICRIGFQGILPAILLSFCLWTSVVYATGLARLTIGHLNLIGAVFIPLLLGLGEDFGNYVLMVYQDSPKGEGPDQMRESVEVASSGMVLGALTTAAVFFSLWFHEFGAFREMGIICGCGILLSMISMLTLLPAAMVIRARFLPPGAGVRSEQYEERFPILGRFIAALSRPRRAVLALTILLLWLACDSMHRIPFDYNMTNMLSQSTQTVKYESILREEFGVAVEFAVVCGRNLDDLYEIRDRLAEATSVAVVDSLANYVPRNVEAKRPTVERIAAWARQRDKPAKTPVSVTADETAQGLQQLKKALRRPRRLANMMENRELHDVLDTLDKQIDLAVATLPKVAATRLKGGLDELSVSIGAELGRFLGFMAKAGTLPHYTVDTIPDELKSRYVSKSGRFAAFLSPAFDLTQESSARTFYDQVKSLETDGKLETAGIPLIVYRMMRMVKKGFTRAAWIGMVACLLMLLIDFRRLDLALLCMVPVVCGAVWMIGLMSALGLRWNPMDSIAIPILPGVAVAFGVNIIHRALLEGDVRVALASTGRAAFYSAYTTIVGFGALLMAHHRGLHSFGLVMVLGVACCIISAVTVLPVLLSHLLKRPAREQVP
ncbi:MAG: MMPL family transporter [Candidatus Riflebacteria bacterium]|nr:MMPL family transporter [Candidatus Riflebacteria bacterium]